MGPRHKGIYPGPDDIIVSGRSFEQREETEDMLRSRGISPERLYLNPLPFNGRSRVTSGQHKGTVFSRLKNEEDIKVLLHFEDDPVQATEINRLAPWVTVVLLCHELVEK